MNDKLLGTDKILPAITFVVLKEIALKCFHSMSYHMYNSTVDSNQVGLHNLIKCIARCYSTVRLHHKVRQATAAVTGAIMRKELTNS